MKAWLARNRWPLLAALVVLGTLAGRATWEQSQAWGRAVAFETQGDLERAIDEYRWTLRWYTPWGPAYDDAAAALVDLGKRQQADHPELAVRAFDGLRSGLIAGRHLWQPRADLVEFAGHELPGLLVRVAERSGDRRDKAALVDEFTRAYARPVGVGPWVSLAVTLGFLLWLIGLVQAGRLGMDDDGRLTRRAMPWLGSAGVGFALWAAALWLG